MNKVYKVIFNKVKGAYIVVSEKAKANSYSSTAKRVRQGVAISLAAFMAVGLLVGPMPIARAESKIVAGTSNTIAGNDTVIVGGIENTITGNNAGAIIGGRHHKVSVDDGVIIGGGENSKGGNTIDGDGENSVIAGGYLNHAHGFDSIIAGGHNNDVSGKESAIIAGFKNNITSETAAIIAGRNNNVQATDAVIIGGGETGEAGGNTIDSKGENSVIAGGYANKVMALNTFIAGGNNNEISGKNGAIIGGTNNKVAGEGSVVIGGNGSSASAAGTVALGSNSVADVLAGAKGFDAVTNALTTETSGAWVSTESALAIGKQDGSATRQIIGVAAGTNDTDAVNMAQFKALAKASVDLNYIHANNGTNTQPEGDATTNAGTITAKGGALGAFSVALGKDSVSEGEFALAAMGGKVSKDAAGGIAVGDSSKVEGKRAIAIGSGQDDPDRLVEKGTEANADFAVAIGGNAKATNKGAISLGYEADALGDKSLAMGYNATANNTNATAIGNNANAQGKSATAIGDTAKAKAEGSVSIGASANANGNDLIENGAFSTAIGARAQSKGANSLAMGVDAHSEGAASVALGQLTEATDNAVALGNTAKATAGQAIAVGLNSQATGGDSIAVGWVAKATGVDTIALGYDTDATNQYAVAIGRAAKATGSQSTALANGAQATAANAMAMGVGAQATKQDSLALGANAHSTDDYAVALGSGSTTREAKGVKSYTDDKGLEYNFAGQTPTSVVSVGTAGNERQIVNLAAGQVSETSTDAINGSQLFATNLKVGNIANTLKEKVFGGDSAYDKDGNFTMSDIGKTGENTINGAIGKNHTDIESLNTGKVNKDDVHQIVGDTMINVDQGSLLDNDVKLSLKDNSITGAKIANDAITTDKIQDGTITKADLDTGLNTAINQIETNKTNIATNSNDIAGNKTAIGNNTAAINAIGTVKVSGNAGLEIDPANTDIKKGNVTISLDAKTVADNLVGTADAKTALQTGLGDGEVVAGNTGLVNGGTVNTAIEGAKTDLTKLGFNLTADSGDEVHKNLGEAIKIKGADNITTKGVSANGEIEVALDKNITLDSITTGNTKMDTNGLAVTDGAGNKLVTVDNAGMHVTDGAGKDLVTVNNTGVTIADGPSMTTTGIDAGSKVISNVAPGVNGTDAVNKNQLDAISQGISDNYAKKDASNIEGKDKTAWENKLGDGKVESGNNSLIKGDTLFKEVRVETDGHYIKANDSAAQNLVNLDNKVSTNATGIGANTGAIEKINKVLKGDTATGAQGLVKDVAENKTAIDGNKTAIGKNETAIGENKTAIGNNTTAIGKNTAAINAIGTVEVSGNAGLEIASANTDLKKGNVTIKLDAKTVADNLVKTADAKTALEKGVELSYKSNGKEKKVSLEKGLNFTNGTNTTAEIDENGVVKYNVNPTLTGMTGINFAGGTTINNTQIVFAGNNGRIGGLADLTEASDGHDAVNKNYIDGKITAVNNSISNNANAIDGNKQDIAGNKTSIEGNTTAIDGNKTAIGKNETAIAGNTTAIADNKKTIDENKNAISDNKNAIDNNKNAIDENKKAIAGNTAAIAENKTAIGKNTAAIKENADAIEGNAQNITKNTDNITKNTDAIEDNAKVIQDVKEAVDKKADADLGNITDEGKKVIQQEAQDAVKVEAVKNADGTSNTVVNTAVDPKTGDITYQVGLADKVSLGTGENQVNIDGEKGEIKLGETTIGKDAVAVGATNITDGHISGIKTEDIQDLTDAVNKEYVDNSIAAVGTAIGEVRDDMASMGAHNAALSALKVLQYRPEEKTQIMAGVGRYKNKNAYALGLAVHSNEDLLWNGGISFGKGNTMMVNAGVTWRVGTKGAQNAPKRLKDGPITAIAAMNRELGYLRKDNKNLQNQLAVQENKFNEEREVMAEKIQSQEARLKAQEEKLQQQEEQIKKILAKLG